MGRFVLRRIIQMFFLFLVFLTLTFFLLQAIPGDITATLTQNPNLPPEARTLMAARLGLDQPLFQQYITYMTNFFQGDFGFSFTQYPREVSDIIAERLPRTLMLFGTALILQYWMGFLAGKFLAWRRGRRGEYAITITGVTLWTVFLPWFGLMMIWFFAAVLGWFPIGKFLNPLLWAEVPEGVEANLVINAMLFSGILLGVVMLVGLILVRRIPDRKARKRASRAVIAGSFLLFLGWWLFSDTGSLFLPFARDIAHHLVLPVATLTLVGFAGTMLLTRSSMLETMSEDYVLTARAKGLTERQVRDRHAARTALLPVVTSLVLAVAFVIDGGIITETVFSWPGMGQVLVTSVLAEDVPLAMAAFAFTGLLAVIGHFVADVLYGFLDPRIRVSAQA